MSFVGSTIGHIRIDSRLGTGGMGEVYLGFDPRLERRVAVKTILPGQRLSERLKARFLREARLLSKLGHPAICQVYELIETPEADFLVLEYVQGRTLRQLAAEEALSFERKLLLGEKIALALAAAHREKIVHRDLKADNVMVTPAGEVKVLDFGIARSLSEVDEVDEAGETAPSPPDPPPLRSPSPAEGTGLLGATLLGGKPLFELRDDPDAAGTTAPLTRLTHHGVVVGTLHAMSPEQAAGGKVTEASDLYSLGILLQELFTGASAYEATRELVVWDVLRAATVPITGLDPDLTRLIQDLQSLDPRRRPTAEETAARLRWLLGQPQRRRARRLRFAAMTAAFAVLVALLAVVSRLAVEADHARRMAEQRRKQAERLIGFMIGDLRPKLESVNRLELLDAVGDQALAYFSAIPESELTIQELTRRVDVILQIGAVRRAQGNLPVALETFQKARALAERLPARAPSEPGILGPLIQSYSWIGQVQLEQGQPDAALASWREQLRLARQENDRGHGDEPAMVQLAMAHHNVGSVLAAKGDQTGALASYRECLALQQRLAAARPGDRNLQTETAETLGFVSNSLEQQGDLSGALAPRREFLAIKARLAALDPGNPELRLGQAIAQGFLANLLAVTGDRPAARTLYEKGLTAAADLAAKDTKNTELQRWVAVFHSALASLDLTEGRADAALASLRITRRIIEPLAAQDPTNTDWQNVLAICRSRTAAALEQRDPAAARAEARAAIALFAPLLRGDPDQGMRGAAAQAQLALGHIETARGDLAAARDAWQQALDVLAPCPRPLTFWKVLAPWTKAQLALGHTEEGRQGMERLRAMGYREQGSPPV